jgi:hypothetical protein
MVAIDKSNPGLTLDNCPDAVEFYTDEPITAQLWGMQDIINVADSVHARGKKYGVSEQGILLFVDSDMRTYFNEHVVPHLDFITYSNYVDHYDGGGDDQRPSWTRLKSVYGSKFDRVWISSTADYDEYADLLGHASNLGINTVFFYADGGSQQQLDHFCTAGCGGWLRKFVQEVDQTWCCTTTTYNPETCELTGVYPTGNIVEIY